MAQNVDLKQIEQQTHRHSQQDGLVEFVMGMCLLAMSTRLISPILIVMFPVSMLAFRPALEALRRRFTYRRIGYVKLMPESSREAIAGIALITVVVMTILASVFVIFGKLRDFNLWLKWCPLWGGTVLASMFSAFARKTRVARYYVFATWSLISGLLLSILNFEAVETGTLLYFLAMACLLIPWGLVVFIRFLRKYPRLAEERLNGVFN
jgi:hypothetical protein